MTEALDPHGTLEIVCRRPAFYGRFTKGCRVFIDGVSRLDAPFDHVVRYPIEPGTHNVKVWNWHGNSCSNELSMCFEAGTTRSLVCTRISQPSGVNNFFAQLRAIRSMFREGGVVVGGLELMEAPAGPLRTR